MADNSPDLADGGDVSSTQMSSNIADVWYFVDKGNTLYMTVNGRRRMALMPVAVGEAYQAVHTASTDAARTAAADRLLRALNVDPMAVHAYRTDLDIPRADQTVVGDPS